MYSFPPTEYGTIRGTTGIAWPFTSTGICQSRLPVFASKAWIIPTPPGYCVVSTTRPIRARPLAVVVTVLEQSVAVPLLGPARVAFSVCFQTILFVAGLNATSWAVESELGTLTVSHCMTPPKPPAPLPPTVAITGCWSAAGGDSIPRLWMLAQTISFPVCGSNDGSIHSRPSCGCTTYCWSVQVGNACVATRKGLPSGATRP